MAMPEELASLKRQRTSAKGQITGVANRAKILIAMDPRELDPEGIQQQLALLSKNDDFYNQCQASIITDHSSSVVVGDEETQQAQHDSDVYEISKVLRNHLDLHEAYKIHDMIDRSLRSLETHLEEEPSASPSKEVEDLRKNLHTLLVLTGKPLATKDSFLQILMVLFTPDIFIWKLYAQEMMTLKAHRHQHLRAHQWSRSTTYPRYQYQSSTEILWTGHHSGSNLLQQWILTPHLVKQTS